MGREIEVEIDGVAKSTRYVVLVAHEDGWAQVGPDRVPATSAKGAIKAVAGDRGEGTYVAVPESSWKPVTATPETSVKFGAAS